MERLEDKVNIIGKFAERQQMQMPACLPACQCCWWSTVIEARPDMFSLSLSAEWPAKPVLLKISQQS